MVAVDTDSQHNFPTEIEFALCEEVFNKLLETSELHKDLKNFSVLKRIIDETTLSEKSNNLYDYLNLGPKHKKEIMENFFDIGDNKVNFAKAYVACDPDRAFEPKWVETIRTKING